MKTAELSDGSVRLLAAACAIVAANAYYVHPIIGRIAEDFGVGAAAVGPPPGAGL